MATLGARMVGAMQGDVATFEEIERDPSALGQAIMVIVIVGLAALVGNIFNDGIAAGIGSLIISLIMTALWALLVVLIGTKLMPEPATKADFQEGFRVIAFAASPGVFNVLAIIPFLDWLISYIIWIWTLVLMVIAVRAVLDYTNTARAIIVCLIAFVIQWIVGIIILTPLIIGRAIMS